MNNLFKPIHSDFIIHWTGWDIDNDYDQSWDKKNSSITNKKVTELYIERLKGILKFGLWMTIDEKDKEIKINNEQIKCPSVSRTCFTELKLSEVRTHAKKFGRLGIGFKRFFLFDRLGSPMIYYHPTRKTWLFPPFLPAKSKSEFKDKTIEENFFFFSCFLKPMAERHDDGSSSWIYTFYDESEWRIIYSDDIKKLLEKNGQEKITKYFNKPCDLNEKEFKEFKEIVENQKPKKDAQFLIPLSINNKPSDWFSMIIYPSLRVRVEAENDDEIRLLIEKLKPKIKKGSYEGESYQTGVHERNSKPIELDLDSCSNF